MTVKRGSFADKRRGSRHERGYGSEWVKTRKRILARDNGMCVPCLAAGRVTVATAVDHIINKERGGTDDDVNLQSICKPCHDIKTIGEHGGTVRHPTALDGTPTDPTHPWNRR